MSTRLAQTGRLIDRNTPLSFTFNGRRMQGFAGNTLASALLANDQVLVGRSFKYHRPRGIVASGAEEPNGLVNLGTDGRFEPNQRVTTQELFQGLHATSQNHRPSLEYDVGALNAKLAHFMPAGFYYKMFIHPRPLWKHLYEPLIRWWNRPRSGAVVLQWMARRLMVLRRRLGWQTHCKPWKL